MRSWSRMEVRAEMGIRRAAEADLEEIRRLLAEHGSWPHAGYRYLGHDLVSKDIEAACARVEELVAGDAPSSVLVSTDRGRIVGVVAVSEGEFESAIFGVSMVNVDELVAVTDDPRRYDIMRDLCAELLRRHEGMTTLRVDPSDAPTLAAAQAAGFRVYNAVMTYVSETAGAAPVEPEPWITHRVFDRSHPPDLGSAARDRLIQGARGAFRSSRFHADPRLSNTRADDFYQAWVEAMLSGSWADWFVVSFIGDDPEMCLALRYCDGFGQGATPSILGEAFGFAPEKRGARIAATMYPWLLTQMPATFVEYPTQIRVVPLLKMLPRHATFLRAAYVLHGWSDG